MHCAEYILLFWEQIYCNMEEQCNEVMFPEVESSEYQVSRSVLCKTALRSNVSWKFSLL